MTMLDFIGDDKFAVVSKSDFQRSLAEVDSFFPKSKIESFTVLIRSDNSLERYI